MVKVGLGGVVPAAVILYPVSNPPPATQICANLNKFIGVATTQGEINTHNLICMAVCGLTVPAEDKIGLSGS